MRMLMITIAASLLTMPVMAAQTYTYDWADGAADYLGSFGADMIAVPDLAANRPDSEGSGLVLTKNRTAGQGIYSLGFLASVWNLQAGDRVTVTLWRYDDSSAMPNFRLWAHYNNSLGQEEDARNQNLELNHGNLFGNNSYGEFLGWESMTHQWVVAPGNTGLVIDAVVYGDLGASIMIDDFSIRVPDHANVRLPHAIFMAGGQVTPTEPTSLSAVKALFR